MLISTNFEPMWLRGVKVTSKPPKDWRSSVSSPAISELVPKVNGALAKIKADGRYTTIYKKWFGVEPPKK